MSDRLFEPFLDHFDTWGETLEYFTQPKFKLEKEIIEGNHGHLYSHPKSEQIKVGDLFIIVGNLPSSYPGGKIIAFKWKEPTPTDIAENNNTVIFTSSGTFGNKHETISLKMKPPSIGSPMGLFNGYAELIINGASEEEFQNWWTRKNQGLAGESHFGSNRYWHKDCEFYIMDYKRLHLIFINWVSRNPMGVKE